MEYCTGRGADLGPVSQNFGPDRDQIDRADVMLAELDDRVRQGRSLPRPGLAGHRRDMSLRLEPAALP
jgi:hypothetical protein